MRLTIAVLLLSALTPAVRAQSADSVAASYRDRHAELMRLAQIPGQVASVENLVLTRDAGRLTLDRGSIYLLAPVGGRAIGAVFRGSGRFTLSAPLAVEQAELRRFAGSESLDVPISQAVLLFSDSTWLQLRGLSWGAAEIPGNVREAVQALLRSLRDDHEGSFDGDVIGPLLNGVSNGFFMALIDRQQGDQVLFRFNPDLAEAVQLHRPASRRRWGSPWAVVTQFAARRPPRGTEGAWHYRERLRVPSYQLTVDLRESFSANIALWASARLSLRATDSVGPWLLFRLHPRIEVDSARWSDGTDAAPFKARENPEVWVRAPRRLAPGDSLSLTMHYRGDIIDRFSNFFFVDPSADWYPVNGQGGTLSSFDLTFRSPRQYPLVSVGERTHSSDSGNVRTTRWVTRHATQFASFNLGLFESQRIQNPGAPPLEVYISEEAHELIRRQFAAAGHVIPQQRRMREAVAADVSNSLALFTRLFGEPPYSQFSVTEIPYSAGVSFPGLIHLSWGTFQNTSLDGFDEFFRAHEAAHQWWGNGVRPASYRDAWLSEGLASFSGLWYLATVRRRDNEYFRFLDRYRADIRTLRDAGPIWNGFRNSTPGQESGYHVMVYEKGAWVFHMLRSMMTDLSAMRSDRFTAMMRAFYQDNAGRAVTTDDFQRAVEEHLNMPMGWFFDQWIRGTALPTYDVSWRAEPAEGERYRIRFNITQSGVPADFRMPVLVSADLGNDATARFRIMVHGGQSEYVSPLLPSRPRDIVFNDLQSVLADDVNVSRM